jgi:hypothetical protein
MGRRGARHFASPDSEYRASAATELRRGFNHQTDRIISQASPKTNRYERETYPGF